jgi:hypothetical protein
MANPAREIASVTNDENSDHDLAALPLRIKNPASAETRGINMSNTGIMSIVRI